MANGSSRESAASRHPVVMLLPFMAVVFIMYLVIGLAMPVLPLHVHQGLGLGPFIIGLVAGSQSVASLVSRMWAGHYTDSRGSKRAVVVGLLVAVGSGLLYLLSLRFSGVPETSVTILIVGRALLGVAESLVMTGALTWGLALMGAQHTGKVMAWVGTALYAALALSAPIGTVLYGAYGFVVIAIAATLIPLTPVLLVARLQPVAPALHPRPALSQVLNVVWLPGLGLALSGVGFGAVTTFIALLYVEHGWSLAWLAFTVLSVAFMVGRLALGHLPDRVGGARVVLVCVLLEATGQALIWLASGTALALAGVALTGLSYSLVYPGLGVEVVRRAPPQSRGLAMGAYTAFLDLSLGVASPALGLVAGGAGLASVFLVSALLALGAVAFVVRLLRTPLRSDRTLDGGQHGEHRARTRLN